MNRPKYISKFRRKTIIEENDRIKKLNEHIEHNLKAKNDLSEVNRTIFDANNKIEERQDELSKIDDNDNLYRELDQSKWKEREYKRLESEYLDYIVNVKADTTLVNNSNSRS